jgi:hypothetical protein
MLVVGNVPKNQPKASKLANDMMLDERKVKLEKRAGQREATKNHMLVVYLDKSGGKKPSTTSPRKPWPTARSWQAKSPCGPSC